MPDFSPEGLQFKLNRLQQEALHNFVLLLLLENSLQIGFGDFVPGSSNAGQVDMQLYVDYCYLLVGLAIVAMNYYTLKEEVMLKSLKFKRKLSEFCHKIITKTDEET